MRCAFTQPHRMSETALLVQPEIGLLGQLFDAPVNKELWRDSFLCPFVSDVLGAFLAEFEVRALAIGFGPGASGTIDSLFLI